MVFLLQTHEHIIDVSFPFPASLQLRRARDSGICTIREELYAQCFGTWDTPIYLYVFTPILTIFDIYMID